MAKRRSAIPEEQELVARANRGDTAAFEQLYRDHRDWVTALAFRFTSSKDDALDVLQETFAYFYGKFPGFTLTSSVRSFLFPVVKHSSIAVIRRRQNVVDLDAYREDRQLVSAADWGPPAASSGDLERLVAKLPEGQREVVRLRFGLDFRLDEIADTLGIPLGTVKSRLHNALRSLRELEEREEQERNGGIH